MFLFCVKTAKAVSTFVENVSCFSLMTAFYKVCSIMATCILKKSVLFALEALCSSLQNI